MLNPKYIAYRSIQPISSVYAAFVCCIIRSQMLRPTERTRTRDLLVGNHRFYAKLGNQARLPTTYATRTNKWSSRYVEERSPSLNRKNLTFQRPVSLIRKV